MDDEDGPREFYEPEKLNWKKQTKFNEIHTDRDISTLFIFYDNEESPFVAIKRWCEENKCKTASISNELYEDMLEISIKGNIIAICKFDNGCLTVRLIEQKQSLPIRKFLETYHCESIEHVAEIPHIEEHTSIKNNQIRAISRSGITKKSGFYPRTFYRFTKNNVLVGRALLGYSESEFCQIGPIILMFEVPIRYRRKGYGTMMIEILEQKMMKYEFPKMFLSNTSSPDFWRKMEYDIDIDEGEKELENF